MAGFIDNYPNEASLGQRQRVALARAVMLEPHYLLLDEITSALDVEQIAKILSYLKTLRGKNIGIFIITHLLGFARHAADQVVFMANGEIAESGSADILRNPQTERLSQFLSVIAQSSFFSLFRLFHLSTPTTTPIFVISRHTKGIILKFIYLIFKPVL